MRTHDDVDHDHDVVLDDLAALVDGDEVAVARHAAHLADCDSCRDARHEAAELVRVVKQAAEDHVAPKSEELVARLMATVDAGKQAQPPPQSQQPKMGSTTTTTTSTTRRSRRLLYVVGVAAMAAGTIGIVKWRTGTPGPTSATAIAPTGTGAQVVRVARAASDGVPGLLVQASGEPAMRAAVAGESLMPGTRIKTDERTRAWLTLADGSTVSLDHATELVLDLDLPRRVELVAGRLVAEVAHLENVPGASFVTPTGAIDVLGTELVLTATADLTSVRVSRGAVQLAARRGGPGTEVRAGEEGTITATGVADVAPSPSLAGDLSWAELVGDASATPVADEASAGLGALRAYRPGESRDRDWALTLAKHEVSVRLVGPIARTEIVETFRNDTDHELEGVYQFPLPADARIDRLALDVPGGGFEEGAFIDRERASKIFAGAVDTAAPKAKKRPAEIIWVPGRWKDPALLEWQRGGRFELRIFPIPAHSQRTIKIGYTQMMAPSGRWRRYVYPLPHSVDGSTGAEELAVDVRVAGAALTDVRSRGYDLTSAADGGDVRLTLGQRGFVPRGDLVIEHRPAAGAELRAWTFAGASAAAPATKAAGARAKKLGIDPDVVLAQQALASDVRPAAVLALRPELPRWRESAARDYVIVVDASQSMVGERHARAVDLTAALIGELDRRDRFTILSCDAECRQLPGGVQAPSSPATSAARDWLAADTAAGASDVVTALRAGLAAVPGDAGREPWVLYVGDGFATTGFRRAGDVEALVAEAATAAGARVTTVGIGSDADATLLAAAARGGGGNFVAWVPGQRLGTAALSVLETTYGTALRDVTVELPDALTDAAPTRLATIRAGEEVVIAARFTGEVKGEVVLRGVLAGQPWVQRYPITLTASTAAGNGFVPRTWASLTIDELERVGRGEDRARVVALSQGYGVLSRATSLLVLESEKMFEAFGIDRAPDAPRWTGDEVLDEVAADGTIAYDDGDDTTVAGKNSGYGRVGTKSGAGNGAGAPSADFADGDEDSVSDPFKASDKKKIRAEEKEHPKPKPDKAKKTTARKPPPKDNSGGAWMRKEWFRVGAVASYDGVSGNIVDAIAAAEAALSASPDSRDRHRALVQALSYAGELDRATQIATAWLARDALDPQALGYLADLLGRQGQRDAALRLLGGVVDLAPDDVALHERLARADDRAGRAAPACGHRIALAAIRAADAKLAGAAMRCLRALGRDGDAALVSRGLASDALRQKAEAAAAVAAPAERVAGDLTLTARWSGGGDVDVTVVTPQGSRVSWMGGRADVVAAEAGAVGRERLGLKKLKRGRYLVEVSRTRAGDTTPVHGTVEVTVLGVTRTLTFDLAGDRAVIGRVVVSMQSRLVPM